MPRRVDQVQLVPFAVLGLVIHRDRVRLDGDAPLLLEIHRVKQLILHVTLRNGSRAVQQPVGQSRLSVVDVGNDAEVPDSFDFHLLLYAGLAARPPAPRRAQNDARKQNKERTFRETVERGLRSSRRSRQNV